MTDLLFLNKIIVLLIDVIGIYLAFWVYLSSRKQIVNQLFALTILLAIGWVSLCYLSGITLDNLELSLTLGRLAYGIAILFLIPFYFFATSFIEEEKKFPFLKVFIPFGSLIIFLFSTFTDFMAKEMVPAILIGRPNGVVPSLGDGKFIYFGFVFFVALFVLNRLFIKYSKLSGNEKLKIQYLLIGLSVFVIANLIFNVILAFSKGDARYYQFGNYSVIFLLGFTAYAIVKRQLFGIKVVLTAILVGAIALSLFIQIFVAPSLGWKIIDSIIAFLFCIFGYYLVKAVQGEERRREEAEMMVVREGALRKKAEKLAEEFKRLDENKTQFMLATQHHLRTPLTSIQGYLSMLYEGSWGKLTSTQRSKVKGAFDSTRKLIRLVNEFLDIAQFEVGKEAIIKREIQIENAVKEVIEELKPEAEKRALYLKFEEPEVLPKIMADPEKIKEALYNVIFNGIKYTEDGGVTIKIKNQSSNLKYEQVPREREQNSWTPAGGLPEGLHLKNTILITVSDTGIGMEREEILILFQKSFSRGEEAKKLYTTGRGIGLYLSYQIVKAHGGRIWAESEGRGKGSTFYVELPVK